MKKSHLWIESVNVRCPHCGKYQDYYTVGDEGDLIICHQCDKAFELGEQK